ncbi:MAG: hypothetical protein AAGU05_01355, partial [Anaerolineaceae bacterium]
MRKQTVTILISVGLIGGLLLSACTPGNATQPPAGQTPAAVIETLTPQPPETTPISDISPTPQSTGTATVTIQPTPAGPVNPVTGRPPADDALLDRRPVL